jgi:hypothetical protein
MGLTIRSSMAAEYRAPRVNDVEDVSLVAGVAPLKALVHLVDGGLTQSDLVLLQKGVDTWLNAGGALPLERCLGLPSTHTRVRKFRRDHWLCKAASMIDADGSTTGSQKLEAEWNKFLSRGPWFIWREESEPPPEATPLSQALFWATRYNRSESLTARHIARIVGHVFTEK